MIIRLLVVVSLLVITSKSLTEIGARSLCGTRTPSRISEIVVILDGKRVLSNVAFGDCCRFLLNEGDAKGHQLHAAFYHKYSNELLWFWSADVLASTVASLGNPIKAQSVVKGVQKWMMYSTIHTYPATVIRSLKNNTILSLEAVIRSNGKRKLEDVYTSPAQIRDAHNSYYQSTPAKLGAYCLYTRRASDALNNTLPPNCPRVKDVAATHAQYLVSAGITNIVLDATNLGNYNLNSDIQQIRPTEVLMEQWAKLRNRHGTDATPGIAAWIVATQGSDIYHQYLRLYNNETFSDLIARDPRSGKKVMFIADHVSLLPPSTEVVTEIERNGGRNDIVTVLMWAFVDSQFFKAGRWTFFSQCMTKDQSFPKPTSSVAEIKSCDQRFTLHSPLGNVSALSSTYQMGSSAWPLQSTSKMYGWMMQLQFHTVFETKVPLQHLMLSSFNEFAASPQAPSYKRYLNAMGLEWDPMKVHRWPGEYACSESRDIEPTVECGDRVYEMMRSCIRILTLLNSFETLRLEGIHGEICGSTPADVAPFSNVWSLQHRTGQDFILENSLVSVQRLSGRHNSPYVQVCSALTGPSDFCIDKNLLSSPLAVSGPFLLARKTRVLGSNTTFAPLFRCINAEKKHFFSALSNCEGLGKMEMLLGFMSPSRDSQMPRSLRRCRVDGSSPPVRFHSLDYQCKTGSVQEGNVLGYVH